MATTVTTPMPTAAELARLRAEVAALRAASVGDGGGGTGGSRRAGCAGRSARWTVSVALVVLASLLAIVSVVSRYVRSELLDTDRYVETVAPLASEPSVQNAVGERVTTEIFTRLDVEEVAEDALSRLTELGAPEIVTGLAVPLADQVESFVEERVDEFLASAEFAELWEDANRRAHAEVRAVLTGESGDVVSVEDGVIRVDVGPVVSAVRDRLVDRGLDLASNIPDVSATFTLVESEQLESAQRYVRILDDVATLVPFVALAVAAAAVLVSPNRRRGLLMAALGIGLAMVALALGARAGPCLVPQQRDGRGPPDRCRHRHRPHLVGAAAAGHARGAGAGSGRWRSARSSPVRRARRAGCGRSAGGCAPRPGRGSRASASPRRSRRGSAPTRVRCASSSWRWRSWCWRSGPIRAAPR